VWVQTERSRISPLGAGESGKIPCTRWIGAKTPRIQNEKKENDADSSGAKGKERGDGIMEVECFELSPGIIGSTNFSEEAKAGGETEERQCDQESEKKVHAREVEINPCVREHLYGTIREKERAYSNNKEEKERKCEVSDAAVLGRIDRRRRCYLQKERGC